MLAYRLEINGFGPYDSDGYTDETLSLLWDLLEAHNNSDLHPNWFNDGLDCYSVNRFACPSVEKFVGWFDSFLEYFADIEGARVLTVETNENHTLGLSKKQLTYDVNTATIVSVETIDEF